MKESKKNKKDESVLMVGDQTPLYVKEYVEKEDLEKLVKAIEKVKKEMNKNYRDIKSEILKNQAEASHRIHDLDDKISRKISNMHHIHDLALKENRESIFKIKRLFKIIISIWIVLAIVFAYLIFSNPQKMGVVEWPEYDHTKPYNPFSDKNPSGTVTVGAPTYDTGLIDNTASPTPFPGMYD